jgi:hypothetical protein
MSYPENADNAISPSVLPRMLLINGVGEIRISSLEG